jgi:hypothetical protein
MKLPLTGGCQCGALRYEVRQAPLSLYVCHCTECQRQSGSAFGLSLLVARDAIAVSGTAKRWRRRLDSGYAIECVFCPECGTRLWHEPERNPAGAVVKPGTLDDTRWLGPVGHIWTKSVQPWFEIPADTVNYDAQPPELSRLISAWQGRSGGVPPSKG